MKKPFPITQSLRRLDCAENELSRLPANSPQQANLTAEIASLRALIPTAILTHHDRMKARGKKSIAPVRNGVCGACHLAIPKGNLLRLQAEDELNVCDSCGAFIYLAMEETAPPAPSTKVKKLAAKKK